MSGAPNQIRQEGPWGSEKKLAHSNDLMRYIIEHANSAIAVHDRDLRYIYVSQRYLDQYKVKEKDVIGKHHYEVFPDLPQKWRDVHQRALAGEVSSADRDPYYRADGTTDWTRWECRPWYEADGVIGGIIVYTEVITDRVRDEEALKQANLVIEDSPVLAIRGGRRGDGRWPWSPGTWSNSGTRRRNCFPEPFRSLPWCIRRTWTGSAGK